MRVPPPSKQPRAVAPMTVDYAPPFRLTQTYAQEVVTQQVKSNLYKSQKSELRKRGTSKPKHFKGNRKKAKKSTKSKLATSYHNTFSRIPEESRSRSKYYTSSSMVRPHGSRSQERTLGSKIDHDFLLENIPNSVTAKNGMTIIDFAYDRIVSDNQPYAHDLRYVNTRLVR